MRNCRCFFFSSSASRTTSSSFLRPIPTFFHLPTPLPATSHSQSQSCRLAWLSARVESFSVNGHTALPLLTPATLTRHPCRPLRLCASSAMFLSFYLLLCFICYCCCCYCCRLLSTFLLFICLTRCAMPLFLLRSPGNNTRVCYCYRCFWCCCCFCRCRCQQRPLQRRACKAQWDTNIINWSLILTILNLTREHARS